MTQGIVHFSEFEVHSRGIASKLLAAMGYVKGTGLGSRGEDLMACTARTLRTLSLPLS